MGAVILWSFFAILEQRSTGLESKHLWSNFQYVGSALAPALWLLFVSRWLKTDTGVTAGLLLLLAFEPLMANVAVWTNGAHGLFYTSLEIVRDGGYSFLQPVFGPLYWVHSAYSWALMLASTILLVRALFTSRHFRQQHFWAVLCGVFLPGIGIGFSLSHLSWVDVSALTLTVSCAVLAAGWTYRTLADNAAAAGDLRLNSLMETAPVGILRFDEKGMIHYSNLELEKMCSYSRGELLNTTIEAILPKGFEEAGISGEPEPAQRFPLTGLHLSANRKDGTRFPVDVGLTAAENGSGKTFTAFIVDVTERRKAEQTKQEHEKFLRDAKDKLDWGVVERTRRQLSEAHSEQLSQQRLNQELQLAAQVQQSLLPRRLPSPDGYSFDAAAFPARNVSGDFFDFSTPEQRVLTIALGDISGRGIAAALLTSTARTLCRVESAHEISPARILAKVNAALYDDLSEMEDFLTMLVVRLEEDSGRLIASNAGSCLPLVYRYQTGAIEEMERSTLPIGVFSTGDWVDEQIMLLPGDTLVLYSDGISEAHDPAESLFGAERLREIVRREGRQPASHIKAAVLGEVERFRRGAPLSDDVTLIVLKALPRHVRSSFDLGMDTLEDVVGFVPKTVSSYGTEFAGQLELASSEIITNILRHGYQGKRGAVRMEIELMSEGVAIDFFDDGLPFEVDSINAPDLDRMLEGGYGLHIIRSCTDELTYEKGASGGNHWHISKQVQSAGDRAAGIEHHG
jgi:PAS domain S-box-containing protein